MGWLGGDGCLKSGSEPDVWWGASFPVAVGDSCSGGGAALEMLVICRGVKRSP